MKHLFCALDELSTGECVSGDFEGQSYFAVKKDNRLFAYRNHCPHLGISLEFKKNAFLNSDGSLIQCSMHGALFTIDEGYCLSGPCSGQSLEPVVLEIKENEVWLKL